MYVLNSPTTYELQRIINNTNSHLGLFLIKIIFYNMYLYLIRAKIIFFITYVKIYAIELMHYLG
jgi:hypothetical protein